MEIDGFSCSCFGYGMPTSRPSGLRSRFFFRVLFVRHRRRRNVASMRRTRKTIAPTASPALAPADSPVLAGLSGVDVLKSVDVA